jgi:hypothetical protein
MALIFLFRDLAANIGIRFLTPEEFFRNESTEAYEHVFVPAKVLEEPRAQDATVSAPFTKKSPQELVIFCGSPGAGKSTFYWDVLQPLGYERVNQDILKTVCASTPLQPHPPQPHPFPLPMRIQSCFRLRLYFLCSATNVSRKRRSCWTPAGRWL